MVTFDNIHKKFGRLAVLKGVSHEMGPGQVHVIMGPNASGKTTLMKSILGLVHPDKGHITVMGESVRHGYKYRRHIGYMPQIARFPENLSPNDLFAMVENIRNKKSEREGLIEWLGLAPFLRKPLRYLSGGTRQKVNAVLALMHDAPVLLFDEPTVGLDPVARIKLKERMLEERNRGKTILLTTHVMSEIEELADEIIFLMDGSVRLIDTPKAIQQAQQEPTLERAIARILEEQTL